MIKKRWTKEEDDFLIENYPLLGTEKVTERLNEQLGSARTVGAVHARVYELYKQKKD